MKALKSAIASFIATVVLSASGIALAADGDVADVIDLPAVVADTRGDNGVNDVEGDGESNATDDSDVADDSQPTDQATPTPDPEVIWDECSNFENADGALVQRCIGKQADGTPVAKSSVSLPEEKSVSDSPTTVASASRVQNQSAPVPSRNVSALTRPAVTGVVDVVDTVVTSNNPDVEKPKLPITSANKGVKVTDVDKAVEGGTQNAASAAVATDNPLIAASSRASLFALVACAAFVVVGAGSVVSVRRLQH